MMRRYGAGMTLKASSMSMAGPLEAARFRLPDVLTRDRGVLAWVLSDKRRKERVSTRPKRSERRVFVSVCTRMEVAANGRRVVATIGAGVLDLDAGSKWAVAGPAGAASILLLLFAAEQLMEASVHVGLARLERKVGLGDSLVRNVAATVEIAGDLV